MRYQLILFVLALFSVSVSGVPNQYDYEYPINASNIQAENAELESIQEQEYSEHLYGLEFTQNDTCKTVTITGSLTAPNSVSLVSISGDQRLGNYQYQNEVRTDFNVEFNGEEKTGEMIHNSEIRGSGADGNTELEFSEVGTNNSFEIEAEEINRDCESKTRTLGVTFRTYKFWDKFKINSIDVPETISKDEEFNIAINLTNPGNRPTGALLEEPNTIQARFTGLTYGVGSVEKEINLSAGETRVVNIPFSLPTNTEETRLTNRVDIEKKEPVVIQISNQRADIVEKKFNLTVEDGREPLDDFNFRIKPEKPYPGETFKVEIFTPEDKPITPDGKIQFIKNGEVLEEWKTSRLSSTTNFPTKEELNSKTITYDSDNARVLDTALSNSEISAYVISRRSEVPWNTASRILEQYTDEGILSSSGQGRRKEISVKKPAKARDIVEANKSVNEKDLDNVTVKVTLNELDGKISESKKIEIADSESGWFNAAYSLLFSGDWFIFG